MSDREKRIRATGFSRITDVEGKDFPEVNLFLQKRWEDKDGNIFAKRVGTMVVRYYNTTDWHNNATYSIMYGDITGDPAYKPHMMRLQVEERYAINSKGESVPGQRSSMGNRRRCSYTFIIAVYFQPWRSIHRFSGNSLWIDNVKLVY